MVYRRETGLLETALGRDRRLAGGRSAADGALLWEHVLFAEPGGGGQTQSATGWPVFSADGSVVYATSVDFDGGEVQLHAIRVTDALPEDVDGDGVVGVTDFLAVLAAWGPCPAGGACPADVAPEGGDGTVGVEDFLAVLAAWSG